MSEPNSPQWPEYVGSNNWIPLAAVSGLTDELTELLASEAADGWIRAVTDAEVLLTTARLEVFWIADGCLHFAVVTDASKPWRVVHRRTLPLDHLAALAQTWPVEAH